MKLLPVFLLCLIFGQSCSEEQAKMLSKTKASEDLTFLRVKVEEIHPDRFFVQSSEQEEQLYQSLEEQINGPLSLAKFYDIVAKYMTSFKDGHTFPSMVFLQDVYVKSLDKGNTILPLEVDFKEDWF